MSRKKWREEMVTAVRKADEEHALIVGRIITNTTLYPRCTRLPAHLRPTGLAALQKQLSEYLD